MNRLIKLLRTLLLWYFLLPLPFTNKLEVRLQAQEAFLFHHLTRNEGLLHDNVTCIAQDSLGFMLISMRKTLLTRCTTTACTACNL